MVLLIGTAPRRRLWAAFLKVLDSTIITKESSINLEPELSLIEGELQIIVSELEEILLAHHPEPAIIHLDSLMAILLVEKMKGHYKINYPHSTKILMTKGSYINIFL